MPSVRVTPPVSAALVARRLDSGRTHGLRLFANLTAPIAIFCSFLSNTAIYPFREPSLQWLRIPQGWDKGGGEATVISLTTVFDT